MTKYEIIKVPSDGDCFFHSFIHGIKKTRVDFHFTALDLRYIVSKIITNRKNIKLYNDLLDEWVDHKRITKNTREKLTPEIVAKIITETKEWTTSTIIHIISMAFKIKINNIK